MDDHHISCGHFTHRIRDGLPGTLAGPCRVIARGRILLRHMIRRCLGCEPKHE